MHETWQRRRGKIKERKKQSLGVQGYLHSEKKSTFKLDGSSNIQYSILRYKGE